MIELRFCSVAGGEWLDSLASAPAASVKKPPKGFGTMIDRAVAQRLKGVKTAGELSASGAAGLVLAPQGIQFDENLLISALHALACAAIVAKTGGAEQADASETFLKGEGSFSTDPGSLRAAGVVSCMEGQVAQKFGDWMSRVDRNTFVHEIRDMHGEESLSSYLAAIEDLRGTLIRGTRIHGCDVCCWRSPSITSK
ncbi:MAG: hypothetical protein ACHRHE_05855 [Tepidisphaerales bacterium]